MITAIAIIASYIAIFLLWRRQRHADPSVTERPLKHSEQLTALDNQIRSLKEEQTGILAFQDAAAEDIESLRLQLDSNQTTLKGLGGEVGDLWAEVGSIEIPDATDPNWVLERLLLMPPLWQELSTKYSETGATVALYAFNGPVYWPEDYRDIIANIKSQIDPNARPQFPDQLNGYIQVKAPGETSWPEEIGISDTKSLLFTGQTRPAVSEELVFGSGGVYAGD